MYLYISGTCWITEVFPGGIVRVFDACSYLDAPDAAAVVQSRVQLGGVPHVSDVPHVHAVVVVHTGQVSGGGVKGHRQRVGVLSTGAGREQVAVETDRQTDRQ